jgi:hypothetical protein
MTISPKFLGGLILTGSDQDVVIASAGTDVRISSVIVSNGSTGGTFTLKFYDSSSTDTRVLANALPISANDQIKSTEPIYLEEGDKLIASAGTTTNAEISVYGLITPSSLPPALSGHTIENEGTPLTQRSNLNFIGSLVIASDNVDTTDVTINFDKTEITGKTPVAVAPTDNLLITDASDSDNLKRIVASDFLLSASASLAGNLNVSSYSIVDTNSNELLKFGVTASAVNEVTITNNSATNNPKISASGGDTDIGLELEAKGTGIIKTNSILTCDKPVAIKIDSGSSTSLDCSLYNGFVRNINANTTFTFANIPSIPNGYQVDFLIHINYTSGTVGLPSGTYINGTSAPTFSTGNSYEIVFRTFDGGSTFYILGV